MRAKKNKASIGAIVGAATLALTLGGAGTVGADGTEQLGPPSITISEGSGVVVGGVGLELSQPGTINVKVPDGASVEQVLLYWEGQSTTESGGDDTIVVKGQSFTGKLIGGPTEFFNNAWSSTYRLDITDLEAVGAGLNAVEVSGLTFDKVNNGAGIAVIYDDGTTADIQIRDGNDLAFIDFTGKLQTTVAQTFTFAPADVVREASLSLFFSSVTGPASGGGLVRPSTIRATSGGVVKDVNNILDSNDGDEWDSDTFVVNIPAGATELTVQALSIDLENTGDLPASFAWNAATLAVPIIPPPVIPPPVIPPPATTPTTIPEPTIPEPALPETTVPETTTPESVVPTSSVVSTTGPPTTVPPTTVPLPDPEVELPATGRSPWLALGAAVALLAGLTLTAAARRPKGAKPAA